MLEQGHAVDRYVVEEKLGEGGMAVVYRVRHATLGTRHALKVLSMASRDVRERMIQEGRVQATLHHPNIVSVTDVLDVDGAPGLLMEFIRGPALDHWLYNYRPTLEESLTVFRGIVAGVGHAHAKGLIHRDLKPANVMLHVDDKGVHPKVTDFGLAKHTTGSDLKRTRTGTTMGTPAYMAPEQIRDASTVDRRADLYSLGCILYELVCGRTPFEDDDIITLFSKVAAGDYPHPRELVPDLPSNVVECIEGLVESRRDLRLTDCASILEVLDGVSRESFTNAIALDGGEADLAPPRPVPHPGTTTLSAHSSAADAARMFLTAVVTPPPAADRLERGSLAPRLSPGMDRDEPDVVTGRLNLDTPPPRPRVQRAATGVAVLVVGVLAAGAFVVLLLTAIVVFVGASDNSGSTSTRPVPVEPTPVAPQPLVPQPVDPTPVPDPVPEVAPEPVAPVPMPEPTRPTPVKPRPQPVRPTPKPQPTPTPTAPSVPTGSVSVEPTDLVVRLIADGRTYLPGEAIPAGRYDIYADFPGHPHSAAGKVTVVEGRTVSVKCSAAATKCQASSQ